MILLWGTLGDPPLMAVYEALQELNQSVVFLDQLDALDTHITLEVGTSVTGFLRSKSQLIDLATVHAMYLRPNDFRQLPIVETAGEGSRAWQHVAALEDTLLTFAEIMPGLVLNRPMSMASNGSKPFQSSLIRANGFKTPATLITTEPSAVRAFWKQHGKIIYKSVSAVRSIVAQLTAEHEARIENVRWCPTQFQEYISGPDYRVHVVGNQCIACEIVSAVDDYRYAGRQGQQPEIRPYQLPEECTEKCLHLAYELSLPLAGIDLRRNQEGDWYCFEVNPSPGFTYYEQATNQPIARSIAAFLIGS